MTCEEFTALSKIRPDLATRAERAAARNHIQTCAPCHKALVDGATEYIAANPAGGVLAVALGKAILQADAAADDPETRS